MALQKDDVLGTCYLDPEAFVKRAHVFGVGMAIQNATRDDLLALLADASRRVDEICGRNFEPDEITETHRFNASTRRVSVNAPPVTSIVSYRILAGGGQVATFSPDEVFVNNQDGYLELLAFALGTSLATPLISFGLTVPQVEVVYKSYQEPPQGVKKATGIIAAHRANAGFVNALVPAQFGQLRIGGSRFENVQVGEPVSAREALAPYIRLAIG